MKHAMTYLVVAMLLLINVSSAQWHQQSSGTILRTANGSSHWELVHNGIRQDLTHRSLGDVVHGRLFRSRADIPSTLIPKTSNGGKLGLAKKTYSADTFYMPDTVIAYGTEDTTGKTYTYDASGNVLTSLGEVWGGTQWVIDSRSTYTYDGSGNRLTVLLEDWDGMQWVQHHRRTYTYDGSGNMLTELVESREAHSG